MREKGQTEAAKTLETPVFSRGIEILTEKYKFLKRLIKSDPLQIEISQIGKDFDEIVGIFGKALYHMNGEQLIYFEMGQRLGDQRNHYAHGDLDKEFIGTSLLDLMYMEFIRSLRNCFRFGNPNTVIKLAVEMLGHPAGPCRRPFDSIAENGREELRRVLVENQAKGMQ